MPPHFTQDVQFFRDRRLKQPDGSLRAFVFIKTGLTAD